MKTSLLTPYDKGDAKPAGRNLFRKQLLPVARIDYKGRVIDFTRDYLAGLVKAFNDRAYDLVPFQLAPHGNEHTNDPERTRGEIAALELTDDGLDVIVAASDAGAEVLRANPSLGVSARIVEDYQRADGQFFPKAIQHVLGTLDPRITGMRPWEAIEAANADDGEVIDLTALEYAAPTTETPPAADAPAADTHAQEKETGMALTADQEARLGKLLDLPTEQFDALLAPPAAPGTETTPEGGTEGGADGEQLSDDDLNDLLASIEDTADAGTEGTVPAVDATKEPVGASLTAEAQTQIDLANTRTEETAAELKRVKHSLAVAAYEAERSQLGIQFGIPPRIVDLARPLLEGEGRVVELANGKSADAGAIVREVLQEVGRTVKMLDLSVELGSPVDGAAEAAQAAETTAAEERRDLVSTVRGMAGI